jgi:hypothetical protein
MGDMGKLEFSTLAVVLRLIIFASCCLSLESISFLLNNVRRRESFFSGVLASSLVTTSLSKPGVAGRDLEKSFE